MKIERKHIYIGVGVVLAATIGWVIYRRNLGQKVKQELIDTLAKKKGETGTIKDVKEGDAGWSSVIYWSSYPESVRLKTAEAKRIAKLIYDEINSIFTNNDKVISYVKQIKNQAAASHVNRQYSEVAKYKQLMINGFKKLNEATSTTIMNYLNKLPKK